MKFPRLILGFLCSLATASPAQTRYGSPSSVVITTNFIREVDGKIYDILQSQLWHDFSGKIIKKLDDCVRLQTYVTKNEYDYGGKDNMGRSGWEEFRNLIPPCYLYVRPAPLCIALVQTSYDRGSAALEFEARLPAGSP